MRGEDVNLAFAADLENGAAAVADVEISFLIERDAGGDAHAFDVHGEVAAGRDLIHHAVVAAGRVEHAFGVDREAGGVHQIGDQGAGVMVRVDFVNRHGSFLAGRAAEGRVDVAVAVDDGIGNGMQAVGDQDADVALAGRVADRDISPAGAPSGTRTMTKESEPMTMGAESSPNLTWGRSVPARPLPRI